MSNIFYLIAETIADARNGAKELAIRKWQSPFSGKSIARDLVGLENSHDTFAQQGCGCCCTSSSSATEQRGQ